MKKSDLTMIIFVALVAGFVSFLITNSLLGDERKPVESVKSTIVFSSQVDEPNPFVFRVEDADSKGSINPTVPIVTGNGGETSPETCNGAMSRLEDVVKETELAFDKLLSSSDPMSQAEVDMLKSSKAKVLETSELVNDKKSICEFSDSDYAKMSSWLDSIASKHDQLLERQNL
ncbi:hypothetical protein FWF93_03330 [Candidatus Saccharibacteria bacterium]|nr:hypothetical protein [Candidatus Saccharibacteria bacterium]